MSKAHLLPLFLALSFPACKQQDPEPESRPAQARPATGVVHPFELDLGLLLSSNAAQRKRGFEAFRRKWPAHRRKVAELHESSSMPKRLAAAWLLSRLGTSEDLPALRGFLADEAARVRVAAMPGIARLGDAKSIPILRASISEAKFEELLEILGTLSKLSAEISERIALELGQHEQWAMRRAAAITLGGLKSSSSGEALTRLLSDPTWMVRMDAATGLGRRRFEPAHPELLKLLEDPEGVLRATAVEALARFAKPEDLSAIAKLALSDGEKNTRKAAATALGQFPESLALPVIEKILAKKDEHYKVQLE
ncbi:MAG: HEAT repeat domain-containing protein, partial [Planctomycetota bacterium]